MSAKERWSFDEIIALLTNDPSPEAHDNAIVEPRFDLENFSVAQQTEIIRRLQGNAQTTALVWLFDRLAAPDSPGESILCFLQNAKRGDSRSLFGRVWEAIRFLEKEKQVRILWSIAQCGDRAKELSAYCELRNIRLTKAITQIKKRQGYR